MVLAVYIIFGAAMIKEKISQAIEILKEEQIDCWMTFVRESSTTPDPAMDIIVGSGVTWHSAFIITAQGDTIALVGSLDRANQQEHNNYKQIIGYIQSIEEPLLEILNKLNPNRIALNYSLNSPAADGLTYGMYLQLRKILKPTPFAERIVSAENILNKLRGRKSASEIESIRSAIALTLRMFNQVSSFIRAGRTEKEVAGFLLDRVREEGVQLAWDAEHCPAVFTGPDTAGAHAGPTDREVEHGHVLNIDFGIKKNNYCSDLQRSWYILKPGESEAPPAVARGFSVILESISKAAYELRPGKKGHEIDSVARSFILENGYEEYPHALGHQIGRNAHDGGGLLAPKWDRYGILPDLPVEPHQVYTLEPRLPIAGHGIATVEEIVVVNLNGCEFLSARQDKIFLIRP